MTEIDMAVANTTIATKTRNSKVRPKQAPASTAITTKEYGGIQFVFDFLNTKLLGGTLPEVFIVYSRRVHSGGHYSPKRYAGRDGKYNRDEISLNPDGFVGKPDKWIVSVLLHEMCHHWQEYFGKPPSRAYHDKQWSRKMEQLGLMPSNSGMVGGKRTGAQMSHYIIPGGAYERVFDELVRSGWRLNLESTIVAGANQKKGNKTTYVCPICDASSWGKPNLGLICKPCLLNLLPELTWLDRAKTEQLVELLQAAEMPPQPTATSEQAEMAQ